MYEIQDMSDWNKILDLHKKMNNTMVLCFSATWCGPCKRLKPLLEDLSNDPQYNMITFYKVDVDKNEELSKHFNISSIPTTLIIKKGVVKERISGVNMTSIIQALQ